MEAQGFKKNTRCEILSHENLMGYELRGCQLELCGTSSGRNFCWRRRPTSTSMWITHRKSCWFAEVLKMAFTIQPVYILGTSGSIQVYCKFEKGNMILSKFSVIICMSMEWFQFPHSSNFQLDFSFASGFHLKSDLNQISSALFISLSSHPSLLAHAEQATCYFRKWVLPFEFWGQKMVEKNIKKLQGLRDWTASWSIFVMLLGKRKHTSRQNWDGILIEIVSGPSNAKQNLFWLEHTHSRTWCEGTCAPFFWNMCTYNYMYRVI